MKTAVPIQTKVGLEFYNAVLHEFNIHKAMFTLSELKPIIFTELKKTESELEFFLDDNDMCKQHKMDEHDEVGWAYYREMMDKYSTLNYFYRRQA